jgi:hypothetical protein
MSWTHWQTSHECGTAGLDGWLDYACVCIKQVVLDGWMDGWLDYACVCIKQFAFFLCLLYCCCMSVVFAVVFLFFFMSLHLAVGFGWVVGLSFVFCFCLLSFVFVFCLLISSLVGGCGWLVGHLSSIFLWLLLFFLVVPLVLFLFSSLLLLFLLLLLLRLAL